MKNRTLSLALLACCVGLAAVELPPPVELELGADGARLRYRVELPAGRSSLSLGPDVGRLRDVSGARSWHERHERVGVEAPPLPDPLATAAARAVELATAAELLGARAELVATLADDTRQRIGMVASRSGAGRQDWQAAVDHLLAQRATVDDQWLTVQRAWRELRAGLAELEVGGHALGPVLDLPPSPTGKAMPPLDRRSVERRWRSATAGSATARSIELVLDAPGRVELVTEREDLSWTPRARLVVGAGQARLVRQAVLAKPPELALVLPRLRLLSGSRERELEGPAVPRLVLAAEAVDAQEQRSLSADWRAVPWDDVGAAGEAALEREAGRSVGWDLGDVALPADQGTVTLELEAGPVELLADEWFLAPGSGDTLRRRIGLRLDGQPLLAGRLEVVVDGVVIGHQDLGFQVPGATLHLLAGEDQRLFVVARRGWEADPNLPPNRRRRGSDWVLRNLGAEPLRFACYRVAALSANEDLQIAVAAEHAAGGAEIRPGVWRFELAIPAGGELVHAFGYEATAEGPITW